MGGRGTHVESGHSSQQVPIPTWHRLLFDTFRFVICHYDPPTAAGVTGQSTDVNLGACVCYYSIPLSHFEYDERHPTLADF